MIALNERYITDAEGNRIAVVLDLETYQQLIALLEEYEDHETIRTYEEKQATGHPDTETVSWSEVRARLDARHSL